VLTRWVIKIVSDHDLLDRYKVLSAIEHTYRSMCCYSVYIVHIGHIVHTVHVVHIVHIAPSCYKVCSMHSEFRCAKSFSSICLKNLVS